jgi:hypothetical protein
VEHVKAIVIKWLFTITVLLSLLAIFESASLGQIVLLSIILTAVTYFVGDLILLPVFGMIAAAIADFGLAFMIVWLLAGASIGQSVELVVISFTIAYFIAMCEGLFHAYMRERVLPKKQAAVIPFPNRRFQTEASEEISPDKDKKE